MGFENHFNSLFVCNFLNSFQMLLQRFTANELVITEITYKLMCLRNFSGAALGFQSAV